MSDLIPEYPGDALNELVENSPRFRKAANAVGPGILGAIATVASGNGAVGKGAELAAKAGLISLAEHFLLRSLRMLVFAQGQ